MPTTGPVIPLADIQQAVTLLTAGLIHNQPVPAEHWDQAVTTLARSHQQLGGTTRHLIYTTIAAAHPNADTLDLPRALTALGQTLGLPDPESMDTEDSNLQLRLF
jgi:hypothetical protein